MVSPAPVQQPEPVSRGESGEGESGNYKSNHTFKDTQSHNYTVQNSESILESEASFDHHGTAMLGAEGDVKVIDYGDVVTISEPVQ